MSTITARAISSWANSGSVYLVPMQFPKVRETVTAKAKKKRPSMAELEKQMDAGKGVDLAIARANGRRMFGREQI